MGGLVAPYLRPGVRSALRRAVCYSAGGGVLVQLAVGPIPPGVHGVYRLHAHHAQTKWLIFKRASSS